MVRAFQCLLVSVLFRNVWCQMYIDKPFSHSISISSFLFPMTEVEVFITVTLKLVTADRAEGFQRKYITFNNNWWCACLLTPE